MQVDANRIRCIDPLVAPQYPFDEPPRPPERSEPRHATSGVVMIGKRVVNILYGHGRELTEQQIEDLRSVCTAAAEAYARLIAVQKKKR